MAVLRTFILHHDAARRGVGQFASIAPPGTVVKFSEPTRNTAINAALHAKLTEIADEREWMGRRWSMEVWKRLLVAAWGRASGCAPLILPGLDGQGVDVIWHRTSELTQAETRDLLSFIEAWEAGGDV